MEWGNSTSVFTVNFTANQPLPRPLKSGEAFCHLCRQFFLIAKNAEHMKNCRQRVIGGT